MGGRNPRSSPVAAAFAEHWPLLVARLTRRFGDLSLAEDCASEAFAEAAKQWHDEKPDNPGGWLWRVASRRAIDLLRRDNAFADRAPLLAESSDDESSDLRRGTDETDELALLFGCCHPALNHDAQIALTLRFVCGLSTAQIADAFVINVDTMTRRLTRAKTKLSATGVPFRIPEPEDWGERLAPVLQVIYTTYTAGHASRRGMRLIRGDLCDEARWLSRQLVHLAPRDPEVLGLAALIVLTDARRSARLSDEGEVALLADQDRSLWDHGLVDEGMRLLARAGRQGRFGPFQIQALITAAHSTAASYEETDWESVVRLYDMLVFLDDSPVVRLNRAVAAGQLSGPENALDEISGLVTELPDYPYAHVAHADALEKSGRVDEAIDALRRALDCPLSEDEERMIRDRMRSLGAEEPS